MQELPELELYRTVLAERCAGAVITAFIINDHTVCEDDQRLARQLAGTTIWYVERRAALIVLHLDNGKRLTVQFDSDAYPYICSSEEEEGLTPAAVLRFGERSLCFFGLKSGDLLLQSVKSLEERMRGLGPDPLDKRYTWAKFKELFGKKRSSLKTALADPQLLPGIGPIYSDEIAFAAKLRPDVKLPQLDDEALGRLHAAIGAVLQDAISHGGASVRPLFPGDGFTGGYAERLQVYNREGQPCRRCGAEIRKGTIAGRKAYYCPDCQSDR